MKPLYQKMYATLVGRVDATVEFMEESMLRGQCDWNTMGQAAKRLREALLETEEIFMSEDELNVFNLIKILNFLTPNCAGRAFSGAPCTSVYELSASDHAVRPRRYSAVLWGMAKGTSISPVSMVR